MRHCTRVDRASTCSGCGNDSTSAQYPDSRPMSTADRTDGFTESVIRAMTRRANEYDAINPAQGFPNFGAPQVLT